MRRLDLPNPRFSTCSCASAERFQLFLTLLASLLECAKTETARSIAGIFTMHKCERCASPATVHITEVLGEGKFEEHHVCEGCYPKYFQNGEAKGSKALTTESAGELEEALYGQQECPDCGLKFVDFRNSHRLGCARD